MSVEIANLSISITAVELDSHLARAPLFFRAKTPLTYRSDGPVIVRSDPDEDALALVDKMKRDFPREFEMVGFPVDQDIDSVDLRPFFEEDEIQKHGSNILRWVLLRISSMNSYRLNQIRRVGWEWKDSNQSAFERCGYFTAEILKQFDVDDHASGELLDPVASFLNNLRYHYWLEATNVREQGGRCMPTLEAPAPSEPTASEEITRETSQTTPASLSKQLHIAETAASETYLDATESSKILPTAVENASKSLDSDGPQAATDNCGVAERLKEPVRPNSKSDRQERNQTGSTSGKISSEHFEGGIGAMNPDGAGEVQTWNGRDMHKHRQSSSTATVKKNTQPRQQRDWMTQMFSNGSPMMQQQPDHFGWSSVDAIGKAARPRSQHQTAPLPGVYANQFGGGQFLPIQPIQMYPTASAHGQPLMPMHPFARNNMLPGPAPFAAPQVPGTSVQPYNEVPQIYRNHEGQVIGGTHGNHPTSTVPNAKGNQNELARSSRLPPKKKFSDDVRRSQSGDFTAPCSTHGSSARYGRNGVEASQTRWHKSATSDGHLHLPFPAYAKMPNPERETGANRAGHYRGVSDEIKTHRNKNNHANLPLKPLAGPDIFTPNMQYPGPMEGAGARSVFLFPASFHHANQINVSSVLEGNKHLNHVLARQQYPPYKADGWEKDFQKLFFRSELTDSNFIKSEMEKMPGYVSTNFRSFNPERGNKHAFTVWFHNVHFAFLALTYFRGLQREGNPLVQHVDYARLGTKQPSVSMKRRPSIQKQSPPHSSQRSSIKSNGPRSRRGSTQKLRQDPSKDSETLIGERDQPRGPPEAQLDLETHTGSRPNQLDKTEVEHAGSASALTDVKLQDNSEQLSLKQAKDDLAANAAHLQGSTLPSTIVEPELAVVHERNWDVDKHPVDTTTAEPAPADVPTNHEKRIERYSSASLATPNEHSSQRHRQTTFPSTKGQSKPRLPQEKIHANSSEGIHALDEENFPTLAEASKMIVTKGSIKGRSGKETKERATRANITPSQTIKSATISSKPSRLATPRENVIQEENRSMPSKPYVDSGGPIEAESVLSAQSELVSNQWSLSYASKLSANLSSRKDLTKDEAAMTQQATAKPQTAVKPQSVVKTQATIEAQAVVKTEAATNPQAAETTQAAVKSNVAMNPQATEKTPATVATRATISQSSASEWNSQNTTSLPATPVAPVSDAVQARNTNEESTAEAKRQYTTPEKPHSLVHSMVRSIEAGRNNAWHSTTAVISGSIVPTAISTHKRKKKSRATKLRLNTEAVVKEQPDQISVHEPKDILAPSCVNGIEPRAQTAKEDSAKFSSSGSEIIYTPSESPESQAVPSTPTDDGASITSEQTQRGPLVSPKTPSRARAQPRPGQGRGKKNKTKQKAGSRQTSVSLNERLSSPSVEQLNLRPSSLPAEQLNLRSSSPSAEQLNPRSSPYSMKDPGISEKVEPRYRRQPSVRTGGQSKQAYLLVPAVKVTPGHVGEADTTEVVQGKSAMQELNWTNRQGNDGTRVTISSANEGSLVVELGGEQDQASARLIRSGGIDFFEGPVQNNAEKQQQNGEDSKNCQLDDLIDAGIQYMKPSRAETADAAPPARSSKNQGAAGDVFKEKEKKSCAAANGYVMKGG